MYFTGNQDRFETRVIEGSQERHFFKSFQNIIGISSVVGPQKQFTRLICIPRFCETGTAVMVCILKLVYIINIFDAFCDAILLLSFTRNQLEKFVHLAAELHISAMKISYIDFIFLLMYQLNLKNFECHALSFSTDL